MLHLGRHPHPPLLPHQVPQPQPHMSQYRPILSIIIFIVLMVLSLTESYNENHANAAVDVKKPEPTLSLAQLDARSSLPIPHHSHSSHVDRSTHSSHASSSERDESLTLPSLYPFNISALYKGRWISNPNHRMTNSTSGVKFERDEGTIVYRIRSLPIPSQLRDLIYIDGEMIIHDGIYTTNHDLHYILHGMYQPKTGELHVFANWPDWNSKENLKLLNVTGSAVKALNESIMENQNNQVDEHDKRYAPFCITQMAFRLDTLPPNEASEAEPNSDDGPSTDESDYITDPDNVHLPHRVMNGIIKSDSEPSHCLFRIDVIDASIVRNDIFYAKAINYAIMAGAAALIQIALSKRQMEYAASSSRAAKMSLLTIGQQALLDSYLLLFHLVTGILIDALFSAFMTTAFIQFVIFSIFEMRLMLILWKSRRPDAFNQGWERMRRELSILYMRFYGFLVIGLIIIYQLHALLHYFVFIIYSFWTCQIIFNLIHDTNRALLPSYIIGISFTRLLIPLYLLICPVNFLNQSPNISVGIGLTCYVIITALILLAQDRWGPRFFVPKAFLPAKYDYHRAIPMVSLPRPGRNGYAPVATVNSINTTPVTTTTNEPTPETVTVPVADDAEEIICAICYCEFDPNARLTDTMVCPCDHYFHTPCLTRWMEQKMECPTCRRALPPV